MADELELPNRPDHRDHACLGCGAESTEHAKARFSTPLGTTTIRCCPTKECAAAAAETLRGQFRPGDTVRCLEVKTL
jgi:hypothetical protein